MPSAVIFIASAVSFITTAIIIIATAERNRNATEKNLLKYNNKDKRAIA